MPPARYRKISDLPETMAVFPLSGALVFPRWSLPLNIFEPRYLNMIDDAMNSSRIIGMIQTVGGDPSAPDLASVGCAGRITSYAETDDGRYLISLSGLCRYTVEEELQANTPYRQVRPNWRPYAHDLVEDSTVSTGFDRSVLVASLRRYTAANSMEVDWEAVENAPLETLINALSAGCPLGPMEKQALLEAETIEARATTLMTLLDMDTPGDDTSTLQ